MFSRAITTARCVRLYSTRKQALKLWVKPTGGLSTQVSIKGCTDVDDFAQKVRQELNTNCQIAVFTSLDKEPIRPWLKIKDLLKTDDCMNNAGDSPLLVKLCPVIPIPSKTIYIADTDEDGWFTGQCIGCEIKNDENLRNIYSDGRGLIRLSDPGTLILNFHDIKDGEKYQVYRYAQYYQSWQKKEADALAADTWLTMKSYLMEKLHASPVELPTDFYDSNGDQMQEWDGALFSEDTLYLLEAKHSMSIEKVKQLADRVKAFPQTLKRSAQRDLGVKFSRIVGIACGIHFPENSRKEARRLGLMVIYPHGRRYLVKTGKDLAFER